MRGLIELFVVLSFVIVWALIELYLLHYDRRRAAAKTAAAKNSTISEQPQRTGDPESQHRLHPP